MYEKEYREAMEQLPFSPDFQRRTEERMKARRPRRRRRRWPAAVAALLALALGVNALFWPSVGSSGAVPGLRSCAAAQPEYPDYPRQGRLTFLTNYRERMRDYRSTIGELDRDGYAAAAAAFSDRSAALTLAGAPGENRICSPVNLWFALSMLAEATAGESREQILSALGLEDLDSARQQAGVLWRTLYQDNGLSGILPANSLWLDRDVTYDQNTVDTLAQSYYAGTYRVDMGTDKADKAIRSWLSAQTSGRLEGAVKGVSTSPETVLALFSTLRYYGEWSKKFDASKTYDDIFTKADGTELTVPFMHRSASHDSFATICVEGYNAARLYTENGSVWFILPDEGHSADDLAADPALWASLRDEEQTEYRRVEWSVPKFDVSSTLELADTMKALGVTDVFDPARSDFSALSPGYPEPITLSSARQSARVEADEEGIRGVSFVELMGAGAAAPPDETCIMDLDRPFLFVITSPVEGVPLFAGVVHDPTG